LLEIKLNFYIILTKREEKFKFLEYCHSIAMKSLKFSGSSEFTQKFGDYFRLTQEKYWANRSQIGGLVFGLTASLST